VIINEDDHLEHYGTPRKSGRYPWGSGGNEEGTQRNKSLLGYVNDLKKQGLSEPEIARGLGMTTTQLRALKSIAKNEQKQADIDKAQRLHDKGYSNVAIGKEMGINESSVRSLLAPGQKDKADILQTTANMLKNQVDTRGFIDVGTGVEHHLVGVSRTKLDTAIAVLKEQGYALHKVQVDQLGTSNKTTVKVLAPPGTTYTDVRNNMDKIRNITEYSEDGGRSFLGLQPPLSVNSKRLAIRYAEDGGTDADGVIYVRPGVADVSLGKARYAQVRVAVNDTHYIKGMAMYKDDLPPGVDLMFNTNKNNTGNKLDALKPMKDDPDNPFGSVVRQITAPDPATGKPRVTSAMNIVNEEGKWSEWSRTLSSQMLSKQTPALVESQLNMTFEQKQMQLDEIMRLTNPAVRKKLLESYADGTDSSAVHLKAAALPRTRNHVILPINSMKETEIYAPNYRNGEQVVLIRHPHGGLFEIPELTVNNRHAEAKRLLGNAPDAVGINSKVAERLSGADFDGDTVLVIPNASRKVKTEPPLSRLKDFDPKALYKLPDDAPVMKPKTKQVQMGIVSNLITDMTLKGAGRADLARAVRHSMVVIDAEKHHLDYKKSALDHGITQLKAKYQGSGTAGAATLISRAGSELRIPERIPRPARRDGPVDKATGKKVFEETGATFERRIVSKRTGEVRVKTIVKTQPVERLSVTDDAHTLSSGTRIEKIYANHSNKLKALANEARKAAVNTKTTPYSPSAKTAYQKEVTTLDAKLNLALRNRPLERQAQLIANTWYRAKLQANPNLDDDDKKKIKFQALAEARARTGAQKQQIVITDNEWDAIQAGAITNHKLTEILKNADLERVKQLATPKVDVLMTPVKKNRAQSMLNSGYTQAEVADALGVSLTTLKNTLGGG
jgi:hypothetical protein